MKWQPIETAPKDGSYFITYTPYADGKSLYDVAQWLEEWELFGKVKCDFGSVTHWMPLPPPPKEQVK